MEHELIIAEIRKRKGISQNKLAKLTGMNQGYLSQIEKNIKSPTFRMISQIATALEVCPKSLIRCNKKSCSACSEFNAF
ncbi:MAG: helix-turn-helix transcriptional regulator [Bacteroidota bacterium]|nr:helix-turn-helix transcriptional regulator [Bacteroidota bacterium]